MKLFAPVIAVLVIAYIVLCILSFGQWIIDLINKWRNWK